MGKLQLKASCEPRACICDVKLFTHYLNSGTVFLTVLDYIVIQADKSKLGKEKREREREYFKITVQFSSVAQQCLTLCNPMDCNTPGLPVHHLLPELTQTHVHRVGDAIQPIYHIIKYQN